MAMLFRAQDYSVMKFFRYSHGGFGIGSTT
jgi:hypothetical protein